MTFEQTEQLIEIFTVVLEQLGFMFAEPVEKEEIPTVVESALEADITFTGASSGKLVMYLPQGICGELAANMLGMEPESDQAKQYGIDSVAELLNVVCGQLLTELAGEAPVFDLSLPGVRPAPDSGWAAMLDDERAVFFLVDDQPVMLRLDLSGDTSFCAA